MNDPFFKGMKENETLEQFLDRVVRPNTEFLSNCNKVIDMIVRVIHKYDKYSVDQVIKGGSLGKGTAIRHHSDVDLLVVLNNFCQIEDLANNMSYVLRDFEQYLSANQDVQTKKFHTTPYTVQFEVYCPHYNTWIAVDVLPIIDLFGPVSPLGQRVIFPQIYSMMEQKNHLRKHYAKCFAKIQVGFVKEMPSRVKDLIRLMKYYKYSEDVKELTSYCFELLVIYVWRENGRPNNFTMETLLKDVRQRLASFSSVAISFDDNYDPEYFIDLLNIHPPYILDPANLFHNVAPKDKVELIIERFQFQSMSCTVGQMSGLVCSCRPNSLYEVERKGKLLMRKYDKLPEEKEGSNGIALKVTAGILTVGLGLGFGAFLLSKYGAQDKDKNKNK